jgi:hypothetical protein
VASSTARHKNRGNVTTIMMMVPRTIWYAPDTVAPVVVIVNKHQQKHLVIHGAPSAEPQRARGQFRVYEFLVGPSILV